MRRNRYSILIVSFLFACSVCAQGQEQKKDSSVVVALGIAQVSELALNNSLDIQIAKFDAYTSRTKQQGAESIFDTLLNAEVNYVNDRTKPASSLFGSKSRTNTYTVGIEKKLPTGTSLSLSAHDMRSDSDSPFTPLSPYHEATASVGLTQSIGKNFFGLSDRAGISITRLDIENAEYTSLADIEYALFKAQAAYWTLVLKEEQVRIKTDMLKEAKKLSEIYESKHERGLAEDVDLFAVKAQLEARRNDVAAAELEREIAKNELLYLLNEENIAIEIQTQDELSNSFVDVTLENAMKEAVLHRRDYKKIMNDLKACDIDLAVKKNSLWPQIDLAASYARNGLRGDYNKSWQDISDNDDSEVSFGVTFSIPLENRRARSELKESQLRKEQLILLSKQIERRIVKEVTNGVKEANVLREQLALYSEIVKLQKNKLNEEKERLGYGKSNSDTIIRYEEDFLQSQLALAQLQYHYRIALVNLALVKNTLLDTYWGDTL